MGSIWLTAYVKNRVILNDRKIEKIVSGRWSPDLCVCVN